MWFHGVKIFQTLTPVSCSPLRFPGFLPKTAPPFSGPSLTPMVAGGSEWAEGVGGSDPDFSNGGGGGLPRPRDAGWYDIKCYYGRGKYYIAIPEYFLSAIHRILKVRRIFWWIKPSKASTMQISRTIRRSIAAIILTAGLAYPVCAAVCPKGRGFCPDPGRCFLYVDADKNTLCDYTPPGAGQVTGAVPSPSEVTAQTAVPATTAPASAPSAVPVDATPAGNTISRGFLDSVHISPLIEGVALFLLLTGILFLLLRYGVLGVQVRRTRPALALSAFLSLGISLVATCILAGDTSAGTTYALVFMGAGSPLAAYLWYGGVMTRKVTVWAALVGTLAGMVFVAPIMPMEIGGLVNIVTGVSALVPGILVICAVVLFALVAGRTFCGNICPVGSLQELAYNIPSKKMVIQKKEILELVRLAVFVITVIAAVYLIDLMAMTGLYDLFSLTLSAGFVVAAGLVILSVFLYRPVCRILCPFGVLFSLFAEFSWFRLRRTESCISCRKCERVCPACTAGAGDSKRECYLCGRCTDACPKEGALVYHH